MRAAQDGDQAAYAPLVRKIMPLLQRALRTRNRFLQASDRDDLMQDACYPCIGGWRHMIRSVNLFPGCLRLPTTRWPIGRAAHLDSGLVSKREGDSSAHRGRAQRNEHKDDDFEPAPHLQRYWTWISTP